MNMLKVRRESAALTQEAAAKNLNITQGAISQWETGDALPRAEMLPKIADLYGCTVDDLLRADQNSDQAKEVSG